MLTFPPTHPSITRPPCSASHRVVWSLLTALAVSACFSAHAQVSEQACGPLTATFGPFDYRADHFRPLPGDQMSHKDKLQLVEGAHFTPPVEALVAGNTARLPHGDLQYTISVFPNHHRALVAITKLWERSNKTPQLEGGLKRPVECYFERALRFTPDDNVARLLYATFLIKDGRRPEAIAQMKTVERAAGENGFTHFNVGMLYVDAGMMDEALVQAHRAIALGIARPELRQRLMSAGSWKDPAPPTGEPSASPPAVPSSGPTTAR